MPPLWCVVLGAGVRTSELDNSGPGGTLRGCGQVSQSLFTFWRTRGFKRGIKGNWKRVKVARILLELDSL